MSDELIARLTEAGPRLTDSVLAKMYTNPFWHERFGERATTHGRKDGLFHVSYVNQALAANDPGVIEQYARWLQQVLTTRGMCTRHLADNFDLLAAAISDEAWPDGDRAVAMLAAATRALHYPAGLAAELQDATAAIVAEATEAIYQHHPDWQTRWGDAGRARCLDDLAYHVAYLADSVALATPSVFVEYAVWIADFLERRSIPRAHLTESLDVLGSVIARQLPTVRAAVDETLGLARRRLT